LYEDAVFGFKTNRPQSVPEEWEYEIRICNILNAKDVLLEEHLKQWPAIKTIVRIESLNFRVLALVIFGNKSIDISFDFSFF
jgi:hypothetical protein